MKLLSKIEKVRVSEFVHILYRLATAVLVSIIIQTFNSYRYNSNLLSTTDYYIDMVLHLSIAIIIIETINWVTSALDRRVSWISVPDKRLLFQIVFGIIVPIALNVTIVETSLSLANHNVVNNLSLIDYSMIIFFLVLFINAYYIDYYFSKSVPREAIDKRKKIKSVAKTEKLNQGKTDKKKNHALVFPVNDIRLIIIKEDGCFVFTSENEKLIWPYSLENTMKQLPSDQYFLINRSTIVNIKNIDKVRCLSSRRIQLTLYMPDAEPVFVSQRHSSDFKIWLAENKQ